MLQWMIDAAWAGALVAEIINIEIATAVRAMITVWILPRTTRPLPEIGSQQELHRAEYRTRIFHAPCMVVFLESMGECGDLRRRAFLGLLALAAGCGAPAARLSHLLVLAQAGPGDPFAQSLRSVIEAGRLARVDVAEVAGVRSMSEADRRGEPRLREPQVMVAGPVLVAEAAADHSGHVLARTTPLARLVGEWEVVVSSPRSRF